MGRRAGGELAATRACVARGRFRVRRHFTERMDRRGLFWPDIEAVLASAAYAVEDGFDRLGRAKWRIAGRATDGLELELVCALDKGDKGDVVVFITAYWL